MRSVLLQCEAGKDSPPTLASQNSKRPPHVRPFNATTEEEEKTKESNEFSIVPRPVGEEGVSPKKDALSDYITKIPVDLGGITQNQISERVPPQKRLTPVKKGPGSGSFSWSDFADRLKPNAYKEFFTQTLQSLNYINKLTPPSEEEIEPLRKSYEHKKPGIK